MKGNGKIVTRYGKSVMVVRRLGEVETWRDTIVKDPLSVGEC